MRRLLPLHSCVLVALFTTTGHGLHAAEIRVDDDAALGGDGEAWSTAFKYLQDALQEAGAGDVIWVAGGTYYPDDDEGCGSCNGDQSQTFNLKDIELLGGFRGIGGNSDDERDVGLYESILSGDINQNGGNKSYTVVTTDSNTDAAFIDGFTITDGAMVKTGTTPSGGGGGMRAVDDLQGGGVPDSYVVRCLFNGNKADRPDTLGSGGAVWHVGTGGDDDGPRVKFINCEFNENEAEQAGAIQTNGIPPLVFNSLFFKNTTIDDGDGGGTHGEIELKNCTFVQNAADGDYGGAAGLSVTAVNCIFWDNTSDRQDIEDDQLQTGSRTDVQYCTIQHAHQLRCGC